MLTHLFEIIASLFFFIYSLSQIVKFLFHQFAAILNFSLCFQLQLVRKVAEFQLKYEYKWDMFVVSSVFSCLCCFNFSGLCDRRHVTIEKMLFKMLVSWQIFACLCVVSFFLSFYFDVSEKQKKFLFWSD